MKFFYAGRQWNPLSNRYIPKGGHPCLYDLIYWTLRRDWTYLKHMYFVRWEDVSDR